MGGIKYWVKESEDSYTDFNDRILAFRYAATVGSIDIYMCTPNGTYYWDWIERKWEEEE
jgi:hypothetical protein